MAFEVVTTQEADRDLAFIFHYLSQQLDKETAAAHLADEIEHRYDLLAQQPYLYPLSQAKRLARQGYRKAVIGNYIMLHRVDEAAQRVYIINFYLGKQNYEKYI